MAKKFPDLVASSMSPESIARAQMTATRMREEMPLKRMWRSLRRRGAIRTRSH